MEMIFSLGMNKGEDENVYLAGTEEYLGEK